LEKRNKSFTMRVRNVEAYEIGAEEFAREFSNRFATAVSTTGDGGKFGVCKKGRLDVVFQGDWRREVEAVLTGDGEKGKGSGSINGAAEGQCWGVPKGCLDIRVAKGIK